VVQEHEDADAVIINTCGFVEDAKRESLDAIMEACALNEDGGKRKVIVTGCLAQRYGAELAEQLPETDLVMGFQSYDQLPSQLRTMMGLEASSAASGAAAGTITRESSSSGGGERQRVAVGDATVPFRPEWDRVRYRVLHKYCAELLAFLAKRCP
jgi:ribosomal protein S12 methylthiotransferase